MVSSPDSSASVNAPGPTPSSSAACRTTLTLVESSAAATHSRVWACGGQPPAAVQEDPLHALGQRQVHRQRLPTGELGRRERPGQLDQGQRVTPGLPHQPVPDVVGDRHTAPVGEQHGRGGRVDAAQHQLGQLAAVETADVTVAGGEQQRDPFRSEPAGHEKQCGGGGFVQPMRVIDDAQHR